MPASPRYRAVTLDAFGTLFDFEDSLEAACREILARGGLDGGKAPTARELGRLWGRQFLALYDRHASGEDGRGFRSLRALTEEGLAGACREMGLAADPARGTAVWVEHFSQVRLYPEVRAVLERLAGTVEIAVVSDIDEEMIARALSATGLALPRLFTSEAARAYKQDPGGRLFARAFAALGAEAGEVLHVGDMAADVLGARRAGCAVAWLNRGRKHSRPRALPALVEPDYEIESLAELPAILGLA
jgi:2-haloalkanoic acid dehalogenase type II